MPGIETFHLYEDSIQRGVFLDKAAELAYMLGMMEITGRLSAEQCKELRRLAWMKAREQEKGLVKEQEDRG